MCKIILLCGIPASGKSSYSRWLEQHKGFIAWDLEHETLDQLSSKHNLNLGNGYDIESLFRTFVTINKDIVIDWGFPPDTGLGLVKELMRRGVDPWWFDGDRNMARVAFLKRENSNPISVVNLNVQMEKIERFWQEIEEVFAGKIIITIKNGSGHIDPEQIYKIMFG